MDAATPDVPRRVPDCSGRPLGSSSRARSLSLLDETRPGPLMRADGTSGVTIVVHRGSRRPVVAVHGELDAVGEPLLSAVLEHVAATDGTPVLADLSGVPLADTHGLQPALRRDVVIVDASARVRRLLAALGAPPPRRVPMPARVRRAAHRSTGWSPPVHD